MGENKKKASTVDTRALCYVSLYAAANFSSWKRPFLHSFISEVLLENCLAYCYYMPSKHFTFLNCLKIILTVHQRKCINQERSLAEVQELLVFSYSLL